MFGFYWDEASAPMPSWRDAVVVPRGRHPSDPASEISDLR
jgi:hypothetical protein